MGIRHLCCCVQFLCSSVDPNSSCQACRGVFYCWATSVAGHLLRALALFTVKCGDMALAARIESRWETWTHRTEATFIWRSPALDSGRLVVACSGLWWVLLDGGIFCFSRWRGLWKWMMTTAVHYEYLNATELHTKVAKVRGSVTYVFPTDCFYVIFIISLPSIPSLTHHS